MNDAFLSINLITFMVRFITTDTQTCMAVSYESILSAAVDVAAGLYVVSETLTKSCYICLRCSGSSGS